MKTLNVVLTVTLITVTLFYFIDTKVASNRVKDYGVQLESNKKHIEVYENTIKSLMYSNNDLNKEVDSLKAVSLSLQGDLLLYKDSIDNLHERFNIIFDEVTFLNDSDSYKYFITYIRDYDRRYK
jgi:hypothetical protein